MMYECQEDGCDSEFEEVNSLRMHYIGSSDHDYDKEEFEELYEHDGEATFDCPQCGEEFESHDALHDHAKDEHGDDEGASEEDTDTGDEDEETVSAPGPESSSLAERLGINLTGFDYAFVVGGVLFSIVSGFLVHYLTRKVPFITGPLIDIATNYVPTLVMLVGVIYIWRARKYWGGEVSRALEIIGIATAILLITWVPHFVWHVLGMSSLFGVSAGFWLAFFHTLTGMTFFLYMYGFWLFWKVPAE